DVGMLDFELRDQALHPLALETQISARRAAAADDRQPGLLRVRACLGLEHVNERANDDVLAVVGDEPRWHRLDRSLEEDVQEQRLDEVVGMMAECDLGGPDFRRESVQRSAPEASAERTGRCAFLENVLDRLADVRVLDVQLPAARGARLSDLVMLVSLVTG